MSPAGMAAVSWVGLTKVVGRLWPLNWTTEPDTKPVPFTVSVNASPPAGTASGLVLVIVGAPGASVMIEMVCVPEVPPPGAGLETVIAAVPADATSPAAIDARSSVELTKVVARTEPFQRTVEAGTKPEP